MNIRRGLLLALTVVAVTWLGAPAAQAQGFQRFVPFLIDLSGWTGGKPDGMSLQMPGNAMDTATRKYQRSGAIVDAQIIVGAAAQAVLAPTQAGIKFESSEGRLGTSTIDGFVVTQAYTTASKSGTVIVALANNAVFNLAFNGITDDEALALAKKFDWKAIQGALK